MEEEPDTADDVFGITTLVPLDQKQVFSTYFSCLFLRLVYYIDVSVHRRLDVSISSDNC